MANKMTFSPVTNAGDVLPVVTGLVVQHGLVLHESVGASALPGCWTVYEPWTGYSVVTGINRAACRKNLRLLEADSKRVGADFGEKIRGRRDYMLRKRGQALIERDGGLCLVAVQEVDNG